MITLSKRASDLITEHGSVRAAAKRVKVSHPYLHRMAAGEKMNPSDSVLSKLGLKRTVTYTLTNTDKGADNGR